MIYVKVNALKWNALFLIVFFFCILLLWSAAKGAQERFQLIDQSQREQKHPELMEEII